MTNKEENKKLIESFLERTFFKSWRDPDRIFFDRAEFQFSSKCNLKCSYCYYNNTNGFGNKLNPPSISRKDQVYENFLSIINYFEENQFFPKQIEMFGGEVLNHSYVFDIVDKTMDYYIKWDKKLYISLPTNMSFLRSESKTKRLSELKEKGRKHNIRIGISASVDGKYMDKENRQVSCTSDQDKFYNDEFYDKLFSFAKNHGCGFHPMIYHENIEKWKDNFIWFQKKFKQYDIPWHNIYLLEVRNDGWNKESVTHFKDFYKFVLNWVFHTKLNKDKNLFIKGFVLNGFDGYKYIPKMNMFNNISTIGRGIGCGLQSALHIRLGDLTVNSCHRLSYDMFNGFKFIKSGDKIVDIEPLNVPFFFSTISTEHKNWPYCESCLIKHICMSGCMGAQYESTGDPFTPIPSVCLLEFGKVSAQIEFFVENDMFEDFINNIREDKKRTFIEFRKIKEKCNE